MKDPSVGSQIWMGEGAGFSVTRDFRKNGEKKIEDQQKWKNNAKKIRLMASLVLYYFTKVICVRKCKCNYALKGKFEKNAKIKKCFYNCSILR